MKKLYRLWKRIHYKNGKVGDWAVACTADASITYYNNIEFLIRYEKENSRKTGRAVEFKAEVCEVSSWKPCTVEEAETLGGKYKKGGANG